MNINFKLVTRTQYNELLAEKRALETSNANLLKNVQDVEANVEKIKRFDELEADRNALFNEGQELKEKQINHEKNVAELTAAHAKAIEEMKAGYEQQLVDNVNTISTLKAENEKQLADMKADYEKQISDEQAKVVLAENSSETKAIKTVAKIGIPEAELPRVTTDKTQVLDEARKLQGTALSEYFNNNKKAIFDALKEARKKK